MGHLIEHIKSLGTWTFTWETTRISLHWFTPFTLLFLRFCSFCYSLRMHTKRETVSCCTGKGCWNGLSGISSSMAIEVLWRVENVPSNLIHFAVLRTTISTVGYETWWKTLIEIITDDGFISVLSLNQPAGSWLRERLTELLGYWDPLQTPMESKFLKKLVLISQYVVSHLYRIIREELSN